MNPAFSPPKKNYLKVCNMEFNSQICTTRSQSEALLKLGLKKETADCMYSVMTKEYNGRCILEEDRQYHLCLFYQEEVQSVGFEAYEHIPAWSLHRLLCLIPKEINIDGFKFPLRSDVIMRLEDVDFMYERLIGIIERVIKEGYFNKEYFEEQV